MEKALTPSNETKRLRDLYEYNILDTPAESDSRLMESRLKNKSPLMTIEFKTKLSLIMTKEIKSSLASIGTCLQWISHLGKNSKQDLQFTETAVMEFNKKYNQYCLLTEWRTVTDQDHADQRSSELSPDLFPELADEINEKLPSRKHHLTIDGIPGTCKNSPSLHFIIKAVAMALANCTSEGKISLHFEPFKNTRTRIGVILESDKTILKMDNIIRHFNTEAIWPENMNTLPPFPEIALAKDLLEYQNGQLAAQAAERNKIHVSIIL